ncbi:hypothetical protein [Sulfitobacter sp.]|uniref:hypothetical protein n=1 Tax=Sulfitobacter sp. TaxID=1903071 RepID=UPI003001B72F
MNGDFQSILQLAVAMNMGFSAVLFYFGDPFVELRQRAAVMRSIWDSIKENSPECSVATEILNANWSLNTAEGLLKNAVLPKWVFIALATSALVFSGISFYLLIDFTILANEAIVKPTFLLNYPRLTILILFTPIILSLLIPVMVTIFKRKKISLALESASNQLSKYKISIVEK